MKKNSFNSEFERFFSLEIDVGRVQPTVLKVGEVSSRFASNRLEVKPWLTLFLRDPSICKLHGTECILEFLDHPKTNRADFGWHFGIFRIDL